MKIVGVMIGGDDHKIDSAVIEFDDTLVNFLDRRQGFVDDGQRQPQATGQASFIKWTFTQVWPPREIDNLDQLRQIAERPVLESQWSPADSPDTYVSL